MLVPKVPERNMSKKLVQILPALWIADSAKIIYGSPSTVLTLDMTCVHTLGGQWPNHGPIHFTHSLYYLDRDYKHFLCCQTFRSWKWRPLPPFSYLSLCVHVWHAYLDVWECVGMPVHTRACSCEDPRLIPRIILNSLPPCSVRGSLSVTPTIPW